MVYSDGKVNPIIDDDEEPLANDSEEALFGKVNLPDSGRMLATPIAIQAIRSDVKQPRRVVPSEIRALAPNYWQDAEQMLNHWHQLAETSHGKPIDVYQGLMGYGVGDDAARTENGVVRGFFDLMALAASIQADGLSNPITIVEYKIKEFIFIIETGERRWLAYHLLAMHGFDDFAKIPARVVEEIDLWRQAGENANREDLVGVALTRQLALLIMDLRVGIGGQTYYPFDDPLFVGACDRKFYAQVANGNIHGIPRGQGQKILNATRIASMDSVRKYRALLSLSDEMWQEADDNNWTEGEIRRALAELKPAPVAPPASPPPIAEEDESSIDVADDERFVDAPPETIEEDGANDLIDETNDNGQTTITWANTNEPNFQISDRVTTPMGIGIIKARSRVLAQNYDERGLFITLEDSGNPMVYHLVDVEMMISQTPAPVGSEPVDDALPIIDGYPDLEELFKILAATVDYGTASEDVGAVIGLSGGSIKQAVFEMGIDDFEIEMAKHWNVLEEKMEMLLQQYSQFYNVVMQTAHDFADGIDGE